MIEVDGSQQEIVEATEAILRCYGVGLIEAKPAEIKRLGGSVKRYRHY
jgi:hypothetical protein